MLGRTKRKDKTIEMRRTSTSGRDKQRVQLLRSRSATKAAALVLYHVDVSVLSGFLYRSGGTHCHPEQTAMPQLFSPLALRALRTLIQRPAVSSIPLRTFTTSTSAFAPRSTIISRFKLQPVFHTPTAVGLPTTATRQFSSSPIIRATYNQVRRGCRGGQRARRSRSPALKDHPSLKGVCLKTGITKPKKPNSGERKTARVRLSSGKVVSCIIPGEGMPFARKFWHPETHS